MDTTKLAAVVAFAIASTCALSKDALPSLMDLDATTNEEMLQRSEPEEHRLVMQFVEAAETLSCGGKELELLRVQLKVERLTCGSFVMTSNPPKRQIRFNTPTRWYAKTITLRGTAAKATPLAQN